MNTELIRAINAFNKHKVEYWIDSGTLLGLVRDKDIPKGDDDIDFAIWAEDIGKLGPIIKELEPHYKEQKGIKFIPESTILNHVRGGLHISIHYYHKRKDYAYCFMRAIRPKNIKKGTFKWALWIAPQIIYNIFGKKRDTLNPKIHPLGKFKFFIGERVMFKIPLHLLDKTILKNVGEDIKARVPKKYKEYLSFCYGNWHVPNKNWNPMDDGRALFVKDWILKEKGEMK
jgi:phosphorylcholine metabolism protein LicD